MIFRMFFRFLFKSNFTSAFNRSSNCCTKFEKLCRVLLIHFNRVVHSSLLLVPNYLFFSPFSLNQKLAIKVYLLAPTTFTLASTAVFAPCSLFDEPRETLRHIGTSDCGGSIVYPFVLAPISPCSFTS